MGSWRGGQAGRDLLDAFNDGKVYARNVDLLRRVHDTREERIVIKTRLDADNRLNVRYLEVMQEEAVRKLMSKGVKKEEEETVAAAVAGGRMWNGIPQPTPRSRRKTRRIKARPSGCTGAP